MASRVCSVATTLLVCVYLLAGCEARATTHAHCAPACHCYQLDGLRAANCSNLHNISSIAHSLEVLRVDEFGGGGHLSLHFRPLVNLKRLYLSHLGLHKVHPAAFSGLHQLQVLDLSHNRFAVPSDIAKAVSQLPKLERLLLRGNPLERVPLLTSKQLVYLDLGSCKITNISDSSLKNLSGLKHLKLDNNRLTVVKPKWFPQSIMSLDLSSNYIRHFSRHEFHNLSHLEHIEISGNPIHCTCETLKIRYDFIMNNVVLCLYPVEYRGVDLFSLKKRDFCPMTVSDNRFRRYVGDQEFEDEDDYSNEEGDDEQDAHETEQGHNGDEGSATPDVSKPVESEDIPTHSSEHVHDAVDPHIAADSPSHGGDKEQEDVDTFPASEEDKEMVGSVLDDTSKNEPHSSEGDDNKNKEDTDNSAASEEEEESVLDDTSKNEHPDTVLHNSDGAGNNDKEDTDDSAASEEGKQKDEGESVLVDNKNEHGDTAAHASEGVGDREEEEEGTDSSPANEEERDEAESGLDDNKNEHADTAPHASEDVGNKEEEDTASEEVREMVGSVLDDTSKEEHTALHNSDEVGNKDKEDTDNSPASEEVKEMVGSVLDDTSKEEHTALHNSEGDGNKDKEDTDNSPASEEVKEMVGSVLDETSKNEHLDTVLHNSDGVGNTDKEDTDNSPASEEVREMVGSVLDDTSKEEHTALHNSEGDGNKDKEDTDNSPASEEVKEMVGSVLDETSKEEHLDTVLHNSDGVSNKDKEDTDNTPASEEVKEMVGSVLDDTSKEEHAVLHNSEGNGNKDKEDTDNSPASEEEKDEGESVLDDIKEEHVDTPPHASSEGKGDREEEEEEGTDNSPANEEERDEAESVLDDNKNEHADAAPHATEDVSNKEEEDTASEEVREMVGSVLEDTSKDEHTVLHNSEGDGNKDKEEDTDKSPTSGEEKDEEESVLYGTSDKSQQVDAASLALEGHGNKKEEDEEEDMGEENKEASGVSSQNEHEDIAPHSVFTEKGEDTSNSGEVKHEPSTQNEDQDIPSHVVGGDSLEEEGEENNDNEDGDEMKESDNMAKVQESEHQKEEETISEVLEEHVSHATVSENEPKEKEVDYSLNELSKEDVTGDAFEDSGEEDEDESKDQKESENGANEETHVLLPPASVSQNETSNLHHAEGEEDVSSRMVELDSDEDQVDHDTEVDELHKISSNEHKPQDSEDGSVEDKDDHDENTDTEVDELHNISSHEHKSQDRVEDTVDHEEDHHEVHASKGNETHASASTEEDKDIDDLMKWDAESSGSVIVESQEEGEGYSEEETEDHNEFFDLTLTSTTEPSVSEVESASNETHASDQENETAIFMNVHEETSSRAAYDVSEELEDVSGKHDYMFEEIEGSGTHEDLTPTILEGSGFEESATESSTEDTSESSGYAPLFIGVHSVVHTSHQVENDTKDVGVDDLERTTVSPHADNSLELEEEEEESSGHDEIPIIPPVEPHHHHHDSAVTTEKEPVVEEEVVSRVNVHHVEGAGPPLVQTSTHQPEMEEETTIYRPDEVDIGSDCGWNDTHGDIRQEPNGDENANNSAGSYIVLGVIMCIIVILLAYAVIRSHQKRKRTPRKDVENPGRELQDVSKPLIDSKPLPASKEDPVDETREPLMSKEKEAALSSDQSEKEPVKNGNLNHVPEVVVEKQPYTTETDSPAPAQNNGTATKKPEPNGTLTTPLVNGNGVAPPVSPSSGRVKVVAKELPDSVAKRPILIVNRGTDPTV